MDRSPFFSPYKFALSMAAKGREVVDMQVFPIDLTYRTGSNEKVLGNSVLSCLYAGFALPLPIVFL